MFMSIDLHILVFCFYRQILHSLHILGETSTNTKNCFNSVKHYITLMCFYSILIGFINTF